MPQSGDFARKQIGFFKRALQSDGYGNTETEFSDEPEFVVGARVKENPGGEAMRAARLESRKPVIITVQSCIETRMITPAWKARDMRDNVDYNIRSVIDPNGRRQWIEMLCEEGVAT